MADLTPKKRLVHCQNKNQVTRVKVIVACLIDHHCHVTLAIRLRSPKFMSSEKFYEVYK